MTWLKRLRPYPKNRRGEVPALLSPGVYSSDPNATLDDLLSVDVDKLRADLEHVRRQRDGWEQSAQFQRDRAYRANMRALDLEHERDHWKARAEHLASEKAEADMRYADTRWLLEGMARRVHEYRKDWWHESNNNDALNEDVEALTKRLDWWRRMGDHLSKQADKDIKRLLELEDHVALLSWLLAETQWKLRAGIPQDIGFMADTINGGPKGVTVGKCAPNDMDCLFTHNHAPTEPTPGWRPIDGLHRNGCEGCEHDPRAYPPCWTVEQVEAHQAAMYDQRGTVEARRESVADAAEGDETAAAWVDTPDDAPSYQDAYEWQQVKVRVADAHKFPQVGDHVSWPHHGERKEGVVTALDREFAMVEADDGTVGWITADLLGAPSEREGDKQ